MRLKVEDGSGIDPFVETIAFLVTITAKQNAIAGACPGEVEPVRRQAHASTLVSTAFSVHMGSLGDPI
jgi:hypothetical protein